MPPKPSLICRLLYSSARKKYRSELERKQRIDNEYECAVERLKIVMSEMSNELSKKCRVIILKKKGLSKEALLKLDQLPRRIDIVK